MKKHILICYFFILWGYTNGQNIHDTDSLMHYVEINTYDTIFDKQAWINFNLTHFSDKLTTEFQKNFNHSTPFIVTRIQDHHKYYAIDIIDTSLQYRYTIVSIKNNISQGRGKIIKVNETYYLTIKNITNYSGFIGVSEIPYDVNFRYRGKKIRYKSEDIQNGPPVITKDIRGNLYMSLKSPH